MSHNKSQLLQYIQRETSISPITWSGNVDTQNRNIFWIDQQTHTYHLLGNSVLKEKKNSKLQE